LQELREAVRQTDHTLRSTKYSFIEHTQLDNWKLSATINSDEYD